MASHSLSRESITLSLFSFPLQAFKKIAYPERFICILEVMLSGTDHLLDLILINNWVIVCLSSIDIPVFFSSYGSKGGTTGVMFHKFGIIILKDLWVCIM